MIWIAFDPTRMPKRMKMVAGFQLRGRVKRREGFLAMVVGEVDSGSGEVLRRKGLGINEAQKEGVATRGRWEVDSAA